MAIVKKMFEPVHKVSELQLKWEQEARAREEKVIAAYEKRISQNSHLNQKVKPQNQSI